MEIEVRVNLIELKRAFGRLLARLPDESQAVADFIVFNASGKNLAIVAGATWEVSSATVLHPGQAGVPYPVFCGINRILRFYCGRKATVAFSKGLLRIARTEFPPSKHFRRWFWHRAGYRRDKTAKLQDL